MKKHSTIVTKAVMVEFVCVVFLTLICISRYWIGFLAFANGVYQARSCLATVKGVKAYEYTKEKGFMINDHAFKMPARQVLDKIWYIAQLTYAFVGISVIAHAVAFRLAAEKSPFYTESHFIADLCMGCVWILQRPLFTHKRRESMLTFLTAFHTDGETNCAAVVAALLGGN